MTSALPAPYQNGNWFFLCVRHSGCTFCREELFNFKNFEKTITALGYQAAVVHMGPESSGDELQKKYELFQTQFISDPKKLWFKRFGLPKGNLRQLFGFGNFKRALLQGSLFKHGVGKLDGDGFQLGGVAKLSDGHI